MITKNTGTRNVEMGTHEMLELLLATVRERSEVDVLEDQACRVGAHDRRQTDNRCEVRKREAEHQRRRQQHPLTAETRRQDEQAW
jgi:hypothetical protein